MARYQDVCVYILEYNKQVALESETILLSLTKRLVTPDLRHVTRIVLNGEKCNS